jgi:hypothetical protein
MALQHYRMRSLRMPPAPAKSEQFKIQSVSPPTALTLPLRIGTSARPGGQLDG